MTGRPDEFGLLMKALTRAGDLALAPSADSLEEALQGLEASRRFWTAPPSRADAERLRGEVHRVRALAAQAQRMFGTLAQLSTEGDVAPANYRPDGTLNPGQPQGELVLHG